LENLFFPPLLFWRFGKSFSEDYAAAIGGSETLFAMYDAEEEQTRAESEAR
jgi:hypothetical protein